MTPIFITLWRRQVDAVISPRDIAVLPCCFAFCHGADVTTLSAALGHFSAGFTLSTYTHATKEMKRDAADAIGTVISKAM